MFTPGPVLQRLRKATAAAHRALEDELDAIERLSRLDDRRDLLPRYYRMHASAETVMERWLGTVESLDYQTRRRAPMLAEDLRALSLPVPPIAPLAVDSAAEALGCLYVMEGSTLGGRMIIKALTGKGASLEGLSFLDPYGSETGERWRSFLNVLERDGAADVAGVERGALFGFRHAGDCLVEARAVA